MPPNGSQDTHAQTPKARCDSATFATDEAQGIKVANGFALAGFPTSADLLMHFLKGKGTEVDYRARSPISKKTRSSRAFQVVNNKVQEAILRQLEAGRTRVRLSSTQLPTVAFESRNSDLLSATPENEAIAPLENEATQTDWLGDLSGGLGADPAAGR